MQIIYKYNVNSIYRALHYCGYTVCPGSSDPPEKILNIFASENEVYAIF